MLKEIRKEDLQLNPFTEIGKGWMLICAGGADKHNAMTASWGGLGVMWGKDVSFIVVRPQRYTLEFIDQQEYYSLNFFAPEHKPALSYFGAHSGRDGDKDAATGLTAAFDAQAPYYKEAKLVLICRKLHRQQFDPKCFLDPEIDPKWYPDKDYHYEIFGEIVKVLQA